MKRLKSYRRGQERWQHLGETYSVVDLTAWPEPEPSPFMKAHPAEYADMKRRFVELMRESYGDCPIEVARQEGGNVTVLERFSTFQEARDAIKSGKLIVPNAEEDQEAA